MFGSCFIVFHVAGRYVLFVAGWGSGVNFHGTNFLFGIIASSFCCSDTFFSGHFVLSLFAVITQVCVELLI